jgi:hypothetical protein
MTNPRNPHNAPQWEYLIVNGIHRGTDRLNEEQTELNGYGYDGWELVSSDRRESQVETGGQSDPTIIVTWHFKRPRA